MGLILSVCAWGWGRILAALGPEGARVWLSTLGQAALQPHKPHHPCPGPTA